MAILSIDHISFEYPNTGIKFEDLTAQFDLGESVAIIGQNGAGKTSLSKLMMGLLKPDSGKIMIDHLDTQSHSTAEISRKVGYVFQNPDDQIFHNNVLDEIKFGPKNIGLSKEEIERNVRHAIQLTHLDEYVDKHPYDLPYSMRKFVTIASVLAMDPDIVILDEPTAGQDLYSLNILADILQSLKDRNKLVITITHDMEFVIENFDRILVMANRQIIADGNKEEIFSNDQILSEAYLKRPMINRLAHDLNLGHNIFEVEELVELLLGK